MFIQEGRFNKVNGCKFYFTMSFNEFKALSNDQQLTTVWQQGTYLLNRKVGKSYLNLYALDTFFVEVRYSTLTNQITGWRCFQHTIGLEPYLWTINVV
ncbi:hypothetical protein BN8_p06740 (plasmid) [Fibrisoma limi BUZ 3]|uniref:Uncharacterized protein n=1 Tax=Fibrisoma limi BUZ 3 TaxID=1185876 RepID=I2GTV5_9BACT|nr:hypothetical protein BN8_p06740 [Fibrisoma limi BUZ 3]